MSFHPDPARGTSLERRSSVVLVTHYFPAKGGGVEIVAFELAKSLAEAGVADIVWFASATTPAPHSPLLRCRAVKAWNVFDRRFGIPWPIWSPFSIPALWRQIGAADLVHLHDTLYPGNILAAMMARMRGKPLVITQHIGLVPYRSRVVRGLMKAANRCVAKPLLQRADCVVFISRAVQEYFDRLCKWKTAPAFVPNGVDSQRFRPPSDVERTAARQVLGLEAASPVLIFVGRFVEKKGLPLLRRLAARMPETTWLFAGEGPVDPQRWGLPNVRVFRDRRGESLRELLWAAQALVLPSVGEGFPLVVQEACACGLISLISEETLAGYPPAREVILSEPLDGEAEDRWLARLRAICSGQQALPDPVALRAFAQLHWSWQNAGQFYAARFAALTQGTLAP